MASVERYTSTYSSTPEHLTRPYVIPPIETDPHFLGRRARSGRREQASVDGVAGRTAVTREMSAGNSAAERRAAQAARAQSAAAASAERRRTRAAASRGGSAPMQAQAGTTAVPGSPQRRSAVSAQRSGGAQQYAASASQGPGGHQRKRTSLLGRIVPIIVFLVIAGAVLRPVISDLIDDFSDDSNPTDGGGSSQPVEPPAELAAEPTTDDIIGVLNNRDAFIGQEFSAYAVIVDQTRDGGAITYYVELAGYHPFSSGDTDYEATAELVVTGGETVAVGQLIQGTFAVAEDNTTYYPTLEATDWSEIEFYDLAQDIVIEETGLADGYVTYEATITNTSDREAAYSAEITITPSEAQSASEGFDFLWTDLIQPGESIVEEYEKYMGTDVDGPLEFSIGDGNRF
ncbi:hypothetical protein [Microbacterium halotolerans]|uniref:hypothetical protein n=1 Tax=Microbacterium halotolerans TaxID=246613 RepID=UPI000E6AD952|nr:hypothetical protein [Microbacterium halotolerans]